MKPLIRMYPTVAWLGWTPDVCQIMKRHPFEPIRPCAAMHPIARHGGGAAAAGQCCEEERLGMCPKRSLLRSCRLLVFSHWARGQRCTSERRPRRIRGHSAIRSPPCRHHREGGLSWWTPRSARKYRAAPPGSKRASRSTATGLRQPSGLGPPPRTIRVRVTPQVSQGRVLCSQRGRAARGWHAFVWTLSGLAL